MSGDSQGLGTAAKQSKRRQTMKLLGAFIVMLGLGFTFSARAATLTTDPLTGLPLYPATDSRLHLGNDPNKLPDSQICQSHMQANFYTAFDSKVDATVAWYASHLTGFHKTHAYVDNRSQDKFYNDAGTIVVSVLGDIGKEGENVDTYAVTYYHFQPGLPAKAIISFGQHKTLCR
jgi:hypothetical protein